MTLADTLTALHAVALMPTDLAVQRARHALSHADRWSGWEIDSAARDARVAVKAWDRAAASEAIDRLIRPHRLAAVPAFQPR